MAVLGLSDKIGGDDQRIGAVIGDHLHLGRAGEHIDADLAEQHALGFRHELVAGSDDDVGRLPVNSPKVMAAIACTPPRHMIMSAPPPSSHRAHAGGCCRP